MPVSCLNSRTRRGFAFADRYRIRIRRIQTRSYRHCRFVRKLFFDIPAVDRFANSLAVFE
nr:MAG TPA: hypothetical protein [Caudoviricetes sp.]